MYEELVKQLKDRAERFDYDGWVDTAIVLEQAAEAIEELQIVVNFNKFNSKFWEDRYNSLWDIISPLIEANKEEV